MLAAVIDCDVTHFGQGHDSCHSGLGQRACEGCIGAAFVIITGILMVAAYWAMKVDGRRRKEFQDAARTAAKPADDGSEAAE